MGYSQTQRNIQRKNRRAPRFDPRNPEAIAICDGCGFLVQHKELRHHMDYRGGAVPVWDGYMVCPNCDDQPQPYFQKQVLAPDPIPVQNPRPDDGSPLFKLLTDDDTPIITQDDDFIIAVE